VRPPAKHSVNVGQYCDLGNAGLAIGITDVHQKPETMLWQRSRTLSEQIGCLPRKGARTLPCPPSATPSRPAHTGASLIASQPPLLCASGLLLALRRCTVGATMTTETRGGLVQW